MDFTFEDTESWQTIDLEGIGNDIITNYVKITVNSVYPNTCTVVGFRELKVFGYASGMVYNDNVSKHYLSCISTLEVFICPTYISFFSDFPENIN